MEKNLRPIENINIDECFISSADKKADVKNNHREQDIDYRSASRQNRINAECDYLLAQSF